jgi:bifunctional non-homologous end joining protein LigD
MKARLADSPPAGDWTYEIKFDGFRALALKNAAGTQLLSRNEKDLAEKFPEVAAAVAALGVDDAIIDGEIVALDDQGRSSFQLLQAYELGDGRPPLHYYVFDLLRLDGESLVDRPLAERKARLETLLGRKAAGVIRYSASLGSDADALLRQARSLGLEGLIGKRTDSPYEIGRRSGAWIKLKLHHEQEFVIGGYTPPAGSRTHFGALLIGVREGKKLVFTAKVGTGFNHALLRSLHDRFRKLLRDDCPFDNLPETKTSRYGQTITASVMKTCRWLKPVLVCQVRFAEWTRDGSLRQPVFLGLREDKAATDVVREKAAA